jgi:hypothetical protein
MELLKTKNDFGFEKFEKLNHKKNILSENIKTSRPKNLTSTNFFKLNTSRNKQFSTTFYSQNNLNLDQNFKKLENFKKYLRLNINSPINRSNLNTIETAASTPATTIYDKPFFPKNPIKTTKTKEKIRKFKLIEPEGEFIPGTKLKTIFTEEARKIYLYKRIFFYFDDIVKQMFTKEHKYINNILNIDYAENEKVYEERLKKINEELIKKGKKIKYFNGPTYSRIKIKELQYGVSFMKCVVDYSYPYMVLARVKEKTKEINKHRKLYFYLPTFKIVDHENKIQENNLKNYLLNSINIQNFKKN